MKKLKQIGMRVAVWISKVAMRLSMVAVWLVQRCRDHEAEEQARQALMAALREHVRTQSTVVHGREFKGWS